MLRLVVIYSLIGIAILFLLSDTVQLSQSSIASIEQEELGRDVKIMGTIKSIRQFPSNTIITIMQPEEISIFLYKPDQRGMPLKQGDLVEIIGEIDEYNEQEQIIGNRVRVIK
jgi:RecJ-like exonuclease